MYSCCMDYGLYYCYMDIPLFPLHDCIPVMILIFPLLDTSAVDMRCVELSATWIQAMAVTRLYSGTDIDIPVTGHVSC